MIVLIHRIIIIFIQVSGVGSNRQREKIQRNRDPVPLTEVGTNCKLTFKMPGKNEEKIITKNILQLEEIFIW